MRPKNACMLLLTAFIWGTAFVAQSVGMDYLEPFTFNGVRCLIGAIALLPCIWFFNRGKEKENKVNDENAKREIFFFFSEREITDIPYQLPVPEKEIDT